VQAKTPLLQQYFQAKAAHPGVLLAMRVGDFYEFYGEDAEVAARILEITLTGREDGSNGRIAMAGVPFHSVEKYLARLVKAGQRVALCDQVEDPKSAKGLVKREVTRVISPGTVVEDSMLPSGANNFLAAICVQGDRAGLATLDPSTGEFWVTELSGDRLGERVAQELARIRPSELLVAEGASGTVPETDGSGVLVTASASPDLSRATRLLLEQFGASSLTGFGVDQKPGAIVAASMVLGYAQKNGLSLDHVIGLSTYSVDGFMVLDPATRRSLELTQNLSDGSKKFSLFEALDRTVTAMGGRLMRRWLEQPLLDLDGIQVRLDAVELLAGQSLPRADLRDWMTGMGDMERLVARISTGLASPRDFATLRHILWKLPKLEVPLAQMRRGRIAELSSQIGNHEDLALLLKKALVDDPPLVLREGGVIAPDYDLELDKLRDLSRNGRTYIASLEQQERERTGIATLKVGFNNVFGYYLEVGKSHLDKIPDDYIRKQTTANAERYITAELKDYESTVLGAQDKANTREAELFQSLRHRVAEHGRDLLETARALAELDVLASLAEVAIRQQFVRPAFTEDSGCQIEAGRHPVVESQRPDFVPNDIELGRPDGPSLMVLTGPNMSGKSTYLRQTALIQLMAQIGSFVPARSAMLGLVDRIFARIGAKDELALGQSTFMVEMVESANILHHATPRSLVILDEVGRGTSTYDGLAIAWAMVEFLAEVRARTLFATHYHQLNALADQISNVVNYRVAVEEREDQVVWTHRVLPGGTDRSYGIHVARMAGVPAPVLRRAEQVLGELEQRQEAPTAQSTTSRLQLTLFEVEPSPLEQALAQVDVNSLTPIGALQLLDEWKRTLKSDRSAADSRA